ncbi:OLC1v1038349C1 [Oldenlandia corymbosa var. corymbosa]|uniref:pyridoxal 5'-phosphate synthase n=1 Tax=Oldenlandia corymbosa var. corymbosa TaxID=529605 RepID=A0AAV1CZP7_OLDCO|nr:OLC1v1038349C1 [Oldenlandia corymbosa var. corymbosa]
MLFFRSNRLFRLGAFLQATVGRNGRPSNRTVVFRGFQQQDGDSTSDKIQINTDSRTSKIEEIKHCPFAEICWYFTDTWEQFRINGKVDIIDSRNPDPVKLQQREKAWVASSVRSRLQYLGPAPGLPSLCDDPPPENSLNPSSGPVDAFCVLVLDPDQVDYLNLKKNERMLFRSTSSSNGEKSWTSDKINP